MHQFLCMFPIGKNEFTIFKKKSMFKWTTTMSNKCEFWIISIVYYYSFEYIPHQGGGMRLLHIFFMDEILLTFSAMRFWCSKIFVSTNWYTVNIYIIATWNDFIKWDACGCLWYHEAMESLFIWSIRIQFDIIFLWDFEQLNVHEKKIEKKEKNHIWLRILG